MSFQTEALTHSRGEEVTVFSFSLKGKAGDGEKSVTCAYERDDSASFFNGCLFPGVQELLSAASSNHVARFTRQTGAGKKEKKGTATRETPSCSLQT